MTDTTSHWQERSSWWFFTAFNEDMELLQAWQQGTKLIPPFIKAIHGGVEECPETKRKHFQATINTKNGRKSMFKPFFPKCYIKVTNSHHASIKYCLKAETAVGPKVSITNESYQNTGDLVKELIIFRYHKIQNGDQPPSVGMKCKDEYLALVRAYMAYDERRGLFKASTLADPRTYRVYQMFAKTLYDNYHHEQLYFPEFINEDSSNPLS